MCNFLRTVAAAIIDDDDFVRDGERFQSCVYAVEERSDVLRFVQRGNDEGELAFRIRCLHGSSTCSELPLLDG